MNERIGAAPERGSRVGQFLPNGMLEDNYPRNMWWVAARADEITDKPTAITSHGSGMTVSDGLDTAHLARLRRGASAR